MASASQPRMKHPHAVVTLIAAATAGAAIIGVRPEPVVIYNPSPSVPPGFYVRSTGDVGVGDFVTVAAVNTALEYAAQRNFVDATDRFIKRVAATPGQVVCSEGERVTIDGRPVATRLQHDAEGRALPTWHGCRTLTTGEVFLLGDTDDSFDGRYWGPTRIDDIDGVWTRL